MVAIRTHPLTAILLGAALVGAGCAGEGGVELHFERPNDPALDPFGQTIGDLTLTATVEGEAAALYSATRPLIDRAAPLDFGEVPVASDVRFELAGTAPSGRLMAFGRSGQAVDVAADRVVEVAVQVRRPWVYVGGSDQLIAIDATLGPGEDYVRTIDVGAPVWAAAVTADGALVVVASEDGIELVSTSTHLPLLLDPVALPGRAEDLALSPDGRWAVVTHHDTVPTGVSIVDLTAMRAGETVIAAWVDAADPGSVVVTAETAWVVQDRLDNIFCVGNSSLLAIPLADPSAVGPPIEMQGIAGDLAYEPVTGVVLVVKPCGEGEVLTVAATDDATPNLLLSVPGASAVTVARGRIWAMGHVDGEGAHLILASIPIGGGDAEVLHFPTLEERAVATALAQNGQDGVLQMTADFFNSYDLSVLPDGEHVAILGAAIYLSVASGNAGSGRPIIPALTMVTYEYQLVDLDTGLAAQRLRTSCALDWEPGALLDDFQCARAPGQDETTARFTPRGLTALYGSR